MSDILDYLLPEDRDWLHAHGWEDKNFEYVPFEENNYSRGLHVRRLAIPDEWDAYELDYQYPPFTLLYHSIRGPQGRMFRSLDEAVKYLGKLPRSYVERLAKTAMSLNGLR